MLCPNVMDTCDDLAQAYSTISQVDAFCYASMNTSIGMLSPDPDWLGSVRAELAVLSAAGADWQQKKPSIWTPLLSYFTTYASLFGGVADVASQLGNDKAAWLQALKQLSDALGVGVNACQAAEGQFALRVDHMSDIQKVFDTSLDKAWASLADEEQQMIDLAAQITALQDRINSFEEHISSAEISSGQSYIQSSVSISYTLVSTAGADVPYLSVAALVYTVGKLVYDLIVTDQEIGQALDKIAELRDKASQEAQAAAMSKAVIQLIDNFDKSLLAAGRQLPALSTMWTGEKQKVDDAISALNSGATPTQLFDLLSMPVASATWAKLAAFATQLLQAVEPGKPVLLTISKASKTA